MKRFFVYLIFIILFIVPVCGLIYWIKNGDRRKNSTAAVIVCLLIAVVLVVLIEVAKHLLK